MTPRQPPRPTAGASRRREIRLGLDQGDRDRTARRRDGGDPVPAEFARLVRAHARGRSLGPVARIETRRRLTTLRDAAGTSLAEIAEDEVAAQSLGASTTLSRWNELEIELTGGRPRLLRAAAERLRRRGLRPAGRSAKLERALAVDARPARFGDSGPPAGAGRRAGRPAAGGPGGLRVRRRAGGPAQGARYRRAPRGAGRASTRCG